MKLFLVLITVVVMSLAMATSASAVAVVTVDTMVDGTLQVGSGPKDDLNVNIIAVGGLIDRFKLGAEYGIGDFSNTRSRSFGASRPDTVS